MARSQLSGHTSRAPELQVEGFTPLSHFQGFEELLSSSNTLNRKLEEVLGMTKEYETIASLWVSEPFSSLRQSSDRRLPSKRSSNLHADIEKQSFGKRKAPHHPVYLALVGTLFESEAARVPAGMTAVERWHFLSNTQTYLLGILYEERRENREITKCNKNVREGVKNRRKS